jgi:ribosomal protein S18 acetylase RimI-like enzyme
VGRGSLAFVVLEPAVLHTCMIWLTENVDDLVARLVADRAPVASTRHLSMIDIRPAIFPDDLAVVRQLFRAYASGLAIDLGFQDFENELDSLPGKYAAPSGRLLLAWDHSKAVGCVGLRPIDDERCEMKRLYVYPDARASKAGRRLAERICSDARDAGYRRICLDTLPTMAAAITLYRSLGFRPIEPYVFNPIEGAIFLALDL